MCIGHSILLRCSTTILLSLDSGWFSLLLPVRCWWYKTTKTRLIQHGLLGSSCWRWKFFPPLARTLCPCSLFSSLSLVLSPSSPDCLSYHLLPSLFCELPSHFSSVFLSLRLLIGKSRTLRKHILLQAQLNSRTRTWEMLVRESGVWCPL